MDRRKFLVGLLAAPGCTRLLAVAPGSVGGAATGRVVNARDHGILGNGVVDDCVALNAAIDSLNVGDTLFLPAGTYLVDREAWIIRGKSGISITGEGAKTRVITSNQTDQNSVKQDFHSTLVLDQCADMRLSSLVVESRGANYGNTDAYGRLAGGDPRASAIAERGGCALAILRSRRIQLENIEGRRCGSVGVYYLSSCEDISVRNCFANARSLGYAGFAVDNWVESRLDVRRTYEFLDCSVSKEDANYSSKGGIVAEGDNGIPLSVTVTGGKYCDAGTGANALTYGSGITATDCHLTARGVTVSNCNVGIRLNKRGGVANSVNWLISDSQMTGNRVTGVFIAIGSSNDSGSVLIDNSTITSLPNSPWRARGDAAVASTSGLLNAGYMSGTVAIHNARISGGEFGILSLDASRFEVIGGAISGSLNAIALYGAGDNQIEGVRAETASSDGIPVFVSTLNRDRKASRKSSLVIRDCTIGSVGGGRVDMAVQLTGNGALFDRTEITGNKVRGAVSAPRGRASQYSVD